MGVKVSAGTLDAAIAKIMEEYGNVIFQATQEGVQEAAEELARDMKAASPKRTGKLAKSWKIKDRKYKSVRYVGNSTTVKNKRGEEIPLTNILEYSTTRGKPFIKRTFEANADKLARIITGRIKKDA